MSSVRLKRLAGDVGKIVAMPLEKPSSCKYPFFLFKRNHFSTKDLHCSYIVNVLKPLVMCVVIDCKCVCIWFLARAQTAHVDNTFSGLYCLLLTLRLLKICVVLLWNQNLFYSTLSPFWISCFLLVECVALAYFQLWQQAVLEWRLVSHLTQSSGRRESAGVDMVK